MRRSSQIVGSLAAAPPFQPSTCCPRPGSRGIADSVMPRKHLLWIVMQRSVLTSDGRRSRTPQNDGASLLNQAPRGPPGTNGPQTIMRAPGLAKTLLAEMAPAMVDAKLPAMATRVFETGEARGPRARGLPAALWRWAQGVPQRVGHRVCHQKRSVAFRPLTRKPYRCLLFHPSGVGHRGTPIMRTGIQYPRNFVPLMYLCRHNFGWVSLPPQLRLGGSDAL